MGVPAWDRVAKILGGVVEMLLMNTPLPRWTTVVESYAYREDAKHALDGMICWILAKMAEASGVSVDFTLFPRIGIYKGFERAAKKVREESYAAIIREEPLASVAIARYVRVQAEEMTSPEFVKHLLGAFGTLEYQIYKMASVIATNIELDEIFEQTSVSDPLLLSMFESQRAKLAEYEMEPLFQNFIQDKNLVELCSLFSKLRRQVRWEPNEPRVKFNDLGHGYHVACECYTTLLLEGYDEETATKGYFVGLFHDFPELGTGDFPAPMKKAIRFMKGEEEVTLGDLTTRLELKFLQQEAYSRLPSYMLDDFKGIMLEELSEEEKNLFKEADSLSAMIEAKAEIVLGFKRFKKVHRDLSKSKKWSPVIKKWLMQRNTK